MSPDLIRHLAMPHITLADFYREAAAGVARRTGQLGLGLEPVEPSDRRRFRVVLCKWNGNAWARFQKIGGARNEDEILAELERAARRLGHPIIGALELETC
jgi:hypothetical protein